LNEPGDTSRVTNCPNCGERLWVQDRFCPECGTKISGPPNPSPAIPPSPPDVDPPDDDFDTSRWPGWRRKP